MSILDESIQSLHKKIKSKEIRPSELTQAALQKIEQTDSQVKSFLTVTAEQAIDQAQKLDRLPDGNLPLLYGIPGAIKDNMCTEGIKTTCASQILANYIPPYSATAVTKLQEQNFVMVGKTNMDEFAMGSSNENSAFYPTRNPWNLERVPGGSSGGSAAAVAAGQVPFSLGSDTGGSIRQPASYCGVVGLKPTYGLVSRFGLVAYASSLDQIGPFARNVEDTAAVLQAIAGYDELDSTSANLEIPDYSAALNRDIKGLRIAMPKEYFAEGLDPAVRDRVLDAIRLLESQGAVVEEVTLPHTKYAVACYYLLAPAEASSNLARYDGVRYGVRVEADDLIDMYKQTRAKGFGAEVKRRIMLGTYALSSGYYDAYYLRAQKVRTLIKQDFDRVFEKFDVIVSPTAPTVAFKAGEQTEDPMTMYLNDIYTIPVNLAGLPGISVPCGLADGMPVGLQIIGKAFAESTILQTAHAYEQTANLNLRPSVAGGVQA
ncbi:Asp-tRNA(Asn)/Glu-tRNA(Gln) amidotransferase subunit GatA [Effusibacillus dendaii]|uniref:Glutamyl-tRNA(Gln) amidotransferase subunit A n=1 Tax=Effusibacillus dendaii TaxID=2743772 RepID=A0A7I8DAA0_9BACL|nr:Asp-tRNA(Asn)/Glu-tRNA(Gln) amidotransferase subunit GatA [Effusibacillus dendaii]BCJ87108.1 glutamyl-tRNA(Gln) amidotransferase subunit A [Effusibacillus dendaii]